MDNVEEKQKPQVTEKQKQRTDFLLTIVLLLSVFSGVLLWYIIMVLNTVKDMLA